MTCKTRLGWPSWPSRVVRFEGQSKQSRASGPSEKTKQNKNKSSLFLVGLTVVASTPKTVDVESASAIIGLITRDLPRWRVSFHPVPFCRTWWHDESDGTTWVAWHTSREASHLGPPSLREILISGLEVVTDSASEARTTNRWFRLLHPASARDIAYMG